MCVLLEMAGRNNAWASTHGMAEVGANPHNAKIGATSVSLIQVFLLEGIYMFVLFLLLAFGHGVSRSWILS